MFVYIENAHNVSLYKPVFRYDGNSMEELENEIRKYLNIAEKQTVQIVMYDRRFGCTLRQVVTSLENIAENDIYIKLVMKWT